MSKGKLKKTRDVALMEVPFELLYGLKHERRLRKRATSSVAKVKIVTESDTRHTIEKMKRIFLYMHLQNIEELPESDSQLLLEIRHSMNTISTINVNPGRSNFSMNAFKDNSALTLSIEQDNILDLNNYSDNPLLLTLYKQEEVRTADGEAEEVNAELRPVAQGHIDLLQFFCKKRSVAGVRTFLYPVAKPDHLTLTPIPTCKITWEIYTLLPLLKVLNLCNIVFITFESIYNATPELLDIADYLEAEIYFRTTSPNVHNEYGEVSLCKFPTFVKEIINEQQADQKWASMTGRPFSPYSNLGVQSDCKINIGQIFQNLLGTDGVDFAFETIDKDNDYALVCNAVHRYALTDDVTTALENVLAFNEQEIVVDIYHRDLPQETLLRGVVDLSVFLYPKVNACRFAVELIPPSLKQNAMPSPKLQSNIPSEDNTFGDSKGDKVSFAILNICLLWPLTDQTNQISIFTDNNLKREKVKACTEIKSEPGLKSVQQICDETYKQFDEQIGILIDQIVKKELTSTMGASKYYCCQLRNLSNNILKLVRYDFNVRYPTKTNLEFTKLMTWVYKELVERTYYVLQNCSNNKLDSYKPDLEMQSKIIRFVSIYKTLKELGNHKLAEYLLKKIKQINPNDACLRFFLCVYNVETQDFDAANEYLNEPYRERYHQAERFCVYIRMYIEYMQTRNQEETFNQAMSNLLDRLREFTEQHPTDFPAWVLLHSLYKFHGYSPGISFTRWKYENISNTLVDQMPDTPKSRWIIYNDYNIEFHTTKGKQFHKVMVMFLALGLYKFAKFVYDTIADECTEPEQYFITTTFRILLGDPITNYTPQTFSPRHMANNDIITAYHAHITGHLYLALGDQDTAMKNYARLTDIATVDEYKSFKLGLFRYAHKMMDLERYHDAIKAFQTCCKTTSNKLIASIGLGKAMYKLGRLKEAEQHFSHSTTYGMHIPDVWGFLALVNLKMGNNFRAIESWKYARLNPSNDISDEVLQELNKINYHDLFLYVCKPF